jgi:ABC-type branched-subunit amino acid transport system substrate-binding protein/predicted negative regulator of RcsB-dependent stress response
MPAWTAPVPFFRSHLGPVALLLVSALTCTIVPYGSAHGQTQPKPPGASARSETRRPPNVLDQAKALIDNQQHESALTLLTEFLAKNPRSSFLDRAYLLLAAAHTGRQAYAEAVSYLEQLLSEFPDSELSGRARIMLARAKVQMGEPDAALPILAEARSLAPDAESRREALRMSGEIHATKGDLLRAVQDWLEELDLSPLEQRDDVRERIQSLVNEKMDKKVLLRVRDLYPARYPGDIALIRLIELHAARGEEHLTERSIQLFLNRFPEHEYVQTASELLRSLRAKLKSSQYLLAAVVPLSGRLGQFGTETLNGIRLAIEKARELHGLTSVGMVVKDSEANKSPQRAELLDTITEYHPVAIIGPLLSRDLPLAASIAEQAEIPFITPSATTSDVRRYGSFLFSTALTYSLQAQRMADYAIGRLGFRRFAVLYPDAPYGQELTRYFTQEVRQRGGEIIAVEAYKPQDTDFGQQIRRIRDVDLQRDGMTTSTKTSKGTVRITYTPGFDAVFLPGDYSQVALIAPQLVFYDIKVPLLGSNGWNSPDLLRLADRTLDGGTFVDAFFLDSPDPSIREFVERYRRRYQSNPTLFAAQAYDAARLVLDAVRKGATTGRAVREQLARGEDPAVPGVAAPFGPNGVLNRHLFVIQVKQNRFIQLE